MWFEEEWSRLQAEMFYGETITKEDMLNLIEAPYQEDFVIPGI